MVPISASPSETGGSTQELSPEWMPASSMCSMMPAISTSSPSHERVDIHFGGVFEEAVDEDGAVLREGDGFAHVAAHAVFVVDDDHGAAAEHVAGPNEHRIADALARFRTASSALVAVPFSGDGICKSSSSLPKSLRSSARSMIRGIGADDGDAEALQWQRQGERGLAAELDDHAIGLLGVHDVEDVFEGEGLEVEAIAGVVIGGDGLRIAVDHDRFDVFVLQGEGCVAAAVIELDSLADAVGAGAEDHDLFAGGWVRLSQAVS